MYIQAAEAVYMLLFTLPSLSLLANLGSRQGVGCYYFPFVGKETEAQR